MRDVGTRRSAMSLLLLYIEDECIAHVIRLRDPRIMWSTLSKKFNTTSEASIDAYLVEYQSIRMMPSEKIMQYVTHMISLENRMTAVGHVATAPDKEHDLLRRLNSEFAVTTGMILATEKSVQNSIGLLAIQEA